MILVTKMKLKNKEILPCPVCNKVPDIDAFQGRFKVMHDCKVSGKKFIGWDNTNTMDAVNEWNWFVNHQIAEQ